MSEPAPIAFGTVAHAWVEWIGVSERQSLCALAYLPLSLAQLPWAKIPPEQQSKLIFSFRRAIELGAVCAQVLIDEAAAQPAKAEPADVAAYYRKRRGR